MPSPRRLFGRATFRRSAAGLAVALLSAGGAAADDTPRQAMGDAWWTGSLTAPSAATLPAGHFLIEPYLFDTHAYGRFDGGGSRRSVAHADTAASLAIINYGLTDRFTVGAIPHIGYQLADHGGRSSHLGIGDLTLSGQYRVSQYREGGWVPTVSLIAAESLPIGKYDRLGGHPGDGFGSGAWSTMLGVYSQRYDWAGNGRLVRTRLNLTYTIAGRATVQDESVYGTPGGFHGRARPGDAFNAVLAFEYSATRNWVLALDLAYEHDARTRVEGTVPAAAGVGLTALQRSSAEGQTFMVAPAVEYNWTPNLGVIVGAQVVTAGRNSTAFVRPAIALNYVH